MTSPHRREEGAARGFYGIGVYYGKSAANIGTLWRSAQAFGADWIFTVGRRYRKQVSDTTKAYRHVPLYQYEDFDDLRRHLPQECRLVGVELSEAAHALPGFSHPERACYLLGAEDNGLPPGVMERCHSLIQVPGASRCLNVATAGGIVLYDRYVRRSAAQTLVAA